MKNDEAINVFETYLATGHVPYPYELREASRMAISALKGEMPLPEDTVLFNKGVEEGKRLAEEEQADLFTIVALDSAQRAREQMMKEAVEGEVCGRVYDHINVRFADGICKFLEPKNISHIPADVSKYKVGDKVKIIIVKED